MRGIKKRKSLRIKSAYSRIFLLLTISTISIYAFQAVVKANELSWTSENPTYSDSGSSIPTSELDAKNCINQQIFVSPDTQPTQICVYQKDNFRYGYYQKFHNPGMWNAYTENKLVIGIGSDSKMYKLENVSYSPMPLDLPIGDDLFYMFGCAGCPWGGDLYIYEDFIKNLTREFSFTAGTTYSYDTSKLKVLRYPDNNQPLRVNRVDASDNGRWLVMEIIGRGIVRLDRNTMGMKQISGYTGRYGVGLDPRMEMAISDDGLHVAIAGHNTQFIAYDVNDQCGREVNSEMSSEMSNPCPSKQLNSVVDQQYPNGYFSIHKPAFDSEGGELTFYIKEQQVSQTVKKASLLAAGYQLKRLDYLVLGDSYSSGEGDTQLDRNGNKYYLPFTDVEGDYLNGIPREKCHQSTRAYPFLLAREYEVNITEKFATVACSGAIISDISASGSYYGQGSRLKGLSEAQTENLKLEALEDYIPGRVRQLNFVKKYKPSIITIGISGNDVDFSGKLLSCLPSLSPLSQITCDYANTDEGKSKLAKDIANQYEALYSLYTKAHRDSPDTKIYALGYPKFVSTGSRCGDNVQLDYNEREMAERGVEYLNDIIEAAAKKAGIQYLNIENSLNGFRLCDTYRPVVTGIAVSGKSEKQESFHPNHLGNIMIKDKIKEVLGSSTLFTHTQNCPVPYAADAIYCPDHNAEPPIVHPYFAVAMNNNPSKTKRIDMTNESVSKNKPEAQKTDPFTLKPNSTAKRQLHSDPINLGDIVVGDDGSIDTTFTIPDNAPVGYHTLIVEGESYSGEPIELTQTILVTSDKPDDLDENSILDTNQPCGAFLEAANVDADFDDVDDACDPEISEVSPYRVRNGDTQKGENPDYIYVERNAASTSITGVSGDHDPDSDGWAIVAQSTKPQNSGQPAHFWIDDNKVPHVSMRTSEKGCVQFTPRSLKIVEPGKLRKLKQEAKNTNTCRSESSDTDTDNDGVLDNQQTLYRARNGNPANNENPTSIYLERSSVAAEAQLGISDHSYSNVWNLISSSQNDATNAKFVKLVMVTN